MEPSVPLHHGDLSADLAAVTRYAREVLDGLGHRPARGATARTGSATEQPPALPLPSAGLGLTGALAEFASRYGTAMDGSAGPRFLGFVTGGTTPAALAGDWLTSTFDNNAALADSATGRLERDTLAWLCELLALGEGWQGAFVTGATMANFANLAVAREWAGEQRGVTVSDEGVAALGPEGIRVVSGAAHSCVAKALSMLGVGRNSIDAVALQPDREAIDLAALRAVLAAEPRRPTIIVGNAGTVNTVDFDDLAALADLRDEFGCWLHVDAAFGGFAALSSAHRHLTAGIERADSVTIDLHKWLNVPYDSAVQFTRRPDLQVRVFANSAAYLGLPTDSPDFVHLTPENSRRARPLAAWFTLAAYGREGHRAIVEANIAQAARFSAGIEAMPGAHLAAPTRLNVVCFRTDTDHLTVHDRLVADGRSYLTPTVYGRRPALRAAFSNWRTTNDDVDTALDALRQALSVR